MGAVVPVLVGMQILDGPPGPLRLAGSRWPWSGVWLLTAAGGVGRAAVRASSCCRSWPELSFGLFLVFIHRAGGAAILWPLTTARADVDGRAGRRSALVTGTLRLLRALGARRSPRLAGLLDTGGNAFFVLAAQAGRLDVAGVLSSLYPASTVALACLLLRERLTRRQGSAPSRRWRPSAACPR